MGGRKCVYLICYTNKEVTNYVFYAYGNRKYTYDILAALNQQFLDCGYQTKYSEEEGSCLIYKESPTEKDAMFYYIIKKPILDRGFLPEPLQMLKKYIPEEA